MKFGQLIEHYMRNIFLEKSYTNCVGETRPRPFLKKNQNRTYFWITSLKFYSVFIVCKSRGLPKFIETKVLTTYVYFI